MTASASPIRTRVDETSAPWPERLLAVGVIGAAICLFLPWFGYGYQSLGFGESRVSLNVDGFDAWGTVYVLALLAAGCLLLARTVGSRAIVDFDLPVADWFIYLSSSLLMAIACLAEWDRSLTGISTDATCYYAGYCKGLTAEVRYGWLLAIASAALIFSGSMLLRSETRPPATTD